MVPFHLDTGFKAASGKRDERRVEASSQQRDAIDFASARTHRRRHPIKERVVRRGG